MTTFTVLLDDQPLTWTALSREWYRPAFDHSRQPQLSKVVPLMFDRADGLSHERAVQLLAWLVTWLPGERLRIDPEIPCTSEVDA